MAFTEEAVTGLKRHGFPFAPLLKLVNVDDVRPSPTYPFYISIQGQSREVLKRQFVALKGEAVRLVGLLARPPAQDASTQDVRDIAVQVLLL